MAARSIRSSSTGNDRLTCKRYPQQTKKAAGFQAAFVISAPSKDQFAAWWPSQPCSQLP
jgi:hypothetical protein